MISNVILHIGSKGLSFISIFYQVLTKQLFLIEITTFYLYIFYKNQGGQGHFMSKYKLKRLFILLLLPLTYLFVFLAKSNPEKVESIYSQGFYAVVSSAINTITSFFDFSLAEIVIFILIFCAIGFIFYSILKIWRSKKEDKPFSIYTFLVNSLIIVTVMSFSFNIMCGFNYYRQPFTEQINLQVNDATPEELYLLAQDLSAHANGYRELVKLDENGVMILSDTTENTLDTARKAMNSLSKDYPILSGMYFQPKPVKFSKTMSRMGITGVFFPFTYESNINVHSPAVKQPHTMVHELSHLRGFMKEEEANFIAYLACMSSDSNDFKYSGTIVALDYALGALAKNDKARYDEIKATLSPGVLSDLQNNNDYWYSFQGAVNTVSNSINDTYLKANNQKSGVSSYGAMVNLLVAYRTQSV